MNQSSRQVWHNSLWALAQPRSRYQVKQLSSRENGRIANLDISEATVSQMCSTHIQDPDTLWTKDNHWISQTMHPVNKISLNCIESCDGSDGCDGVHAFNSCIDNIYRYIRFRQPNNMSTAYFWDEYGAQYGCSVRCVLVKIRIIRMYLKWFRNRSTSGQPSSSIYGMVFE